MQQPSVSLTAIPESSYDTDTVMYVTMRVDKQGFGIEVKHVRDVLRQQKITPIPLAPPEVAGSLNLRGRIVTVIDLRKRLDLPEIPSKTDYSFVVIELKGELYSLMVDSVSEVLTIPASQIEKTPANFGGAWKNIATGIYKLPGELLVLVGVQALLNL